MQLLAAEHSRPRSSCAKALWQEHAPARGSGRKHGCCGGRAEVAQRQLPRAL